MQYHQHVPDHLEGLSVVMADGDELGRITGVMADPEDPGEQVLVVAVEQHDAATGRHAVYVPRRAIHTIVGGEVIVGTTMPWLEQFCPVQLSADNCSVAASPPTPVDTRPA